MMTKGGWTKFCLVENLIDWDSRQFLDQPSRKGNSCEAYI